METIVFGDITAISVDYLAAGLIAHGDSLTHVGSRTDGTRWITIRLIDSERSNIVVQTSTLEVECAVGDSPLAEDETHDLAQLARGILGSIEGTVQSGVTIYHVRDIHGLADNPDRLSGDERHLFHIAISHRGHAI